MSSTNRGGQRRDGDFYATPAWVVDAIVPHLPRGSFLDPCAGDGAILKALAAHGIHEITGIEIDPERAASAGMNLHCFDALDCWLIGRHDVVILNPPFSQALEFVHRAIAMQAPHRGTVAALLRLSFLAGQKRAAWHRANPSDVYVLPKRPSFTGNGTDSCDYAWFVFGPGRGNRWHVLDLEAA